MRDSKKFQGNLMDLKDSKVSLSICWILKDFKSKTYKALLDLLDFVELCLNQFTYAAMHKFCACFIQLPAISG